MPLDDLVGLAQEALVLSVSVSLPVVAALAAMSFFTSLLQAATQLSDSTLSHLPRLVVGAVVIAATAPWMGAQIVAFASRAFAIGS
jgi:flagellar biosynthetic protein FliQ